MQIKREMTTLKNIATEIKFPQKVVFCINIFHVLLKKKQNPKTPKIHKYKKFHKALWWKIVDYQTFKRFEKKTFFFFFYLFSLVVKNFFCRKWIYWQLLCVCSCSLE